MTAYPVTVTVWTDSAEHAVQVLNERLGPDENYGFDYSVGFTFDYPMGPGTSGPPPTPTVWTVLGFWFADEPISVGAVAGDHTIHGGDDAGRGGPLLGPWATAVEAETASDAEDLAVAQMLATLSKEDE